MVWIPRLRMVLARHWWIYWSIVAALAAALAFLVLAGMGDVRRARDAWGTTTTVWVTTGDLAAGELVGPAVESRKVPLALAPSAALDHLDVGATTTQRIGRGEIVVDADVIDTAGPLAALPTDWLALVITGAVNDTFVPGGPAAVFADGTDVAPRAVVLRVLDDAVVVGVPRAVAAAVADAAVRGAAVVALAGT